MENARLALTFRGQRIEPYTTSFIAIETTIDSEASPVRQVGRPAAGLVTVTQDAGHRTNHWQ